jgi:hypothetical protein
MHATIEEWCFLCGPWREVITRTMGAMRQFSSAREAEKIWCYSSVVGYSLNSNNMSTEAEEFPLLRPVTKQQLMRTLQAGEDLACSDYCKVWKSVIML